MPETETEIGFAQLGLGGVLKQNRLAVGLAKAAHKIFAKEISGTNELRDQLAYITPTDGEFHTAFEVATVSNRKLARYYLRSLELAAKDESQPWHIPNDDRSVINLEHVLPEKPLENWPQRPVFGR